MFVPQVSIKSCQPIDLLTVSEPKLCQVLVTRVIIIGCGQS